MVTFEEAATHFSIKTIVITMVMSAFGFLVALQWRDVIKETIDTFIPAGEGLVYSYFAAILVTIIAVIATFVLIKLQRINIIPEKYEIHKKVAKRLNKRK